jgi:outer membrane lipoprotein-sorting protein
MNRKLLLCVLLLLLFASGCAFSTESRAKLFKKHYQAEAGFSINGKR